MGIFTSRPAETSISTQQQVSHKRPVYFEEQGSDQSEVQEQENIADSHPSARIEKTMPSGKSQLGSSAAAPAQRLLRPRNQQKPSGASPHLAVLATSKKASVPKRQGKSAPPPPPKKKSAAASDAGGDGEQAYEVEAILERKPLGTRNWQYLVKWANYPHSENTWEQEENLKSCPVILGEFLASLKAQTPTGSGRTSPPAKKTGASGGSVKKRARPPAKKPTSRTGLRIPLASTATHPPAAVEDEEYVVEKLLKWRGEGTSLEYLVKWTGYAEEESTWEAASKFADMKALIKDMHQREAKRAAAARANSAKPKKAPASKRRKRLY